MDDKPREELERRMDELAGSMQRPTSQYSKRKWKQSAAASLECWTTIVEYGGFRFRVRPGFRVRPEY